MKLNKNEYIKTFKHAHIMQITICWQLKASAPYLWNKEPQVEQCRSVLLLVRKIVCSLMHAID